jgi:CRP/FNR family cyclic AMP-dependent transcriptional regulator
MKKSSSDIGLRKVPLFAGLNDESLKNLEQTAIKRTYPKNAVIIHEEDQGDSLYIILSGKVRVYCTDEDGNEVTLGTRGPGEYFGELALIDEEGRTASVMTQSPCTFSVLGKSVFKDLLSEDPDMALRIIEVLSRRVRQLTEDVKSLALLDVYGRVARVLMDQAVPSGDKLVIEEKLTQQEIANRVGASREMVARILKELSSGDYISSEGKRLIINKPLPEHF